MTARPTDRQGLPALAARPCLTPAGAADQLGAILVGARTDRERVA
jgi:hypothetical protein